MTTTNQQERFDQLVLQISASAATDPFVPLSLVQQALDLAETPEMLAQVDSARFPERTKSEAALRLACLRRLMMQNRTC